MKDNQKKYLDKVVDLIVRDTKVKDELISVEWFLTSMSVWEFLAYPFEHFDEFKIYCENTYGLGEDEVILAWVSFRKMVRHILKIK